MVYMILYRALDYFDLPTHWAAILHTDSPAWWLTSLAGGRPLLLVLPSTSKLQRTTWLRVESTCMRGVWSEWAECEHGRLYYYYMYVQCTVMYKQATLQYSYSQLYITHAVLFFLLVCLKGDRGTRFCTVMLVYLRKEPVQANYKI